MDVQAENDSLQKALSSILNGRRCLVIGSAPSSRLVPHDRCVCVNGSGWAAKRLGVANPDITVISGWTLRNDTPVRSATLDALSGLKTKTALLIDAGLPIAACKDRLCEIGYSFDELMTVTSLEREEIFRDICQSPIPQGDHNARPSNGLFAVALGFWSGAASVSITGFSLAGGHAYIQGATPREHVAGDKWFLEKTAARRIEIVY